MKRLLVPVGHMNKCIFLCKKLLYCTENISTNKILPVRYIDIACVLSFSSAVVKAFESVPVLNVMITGMW